MTNWNVREKRATRRILLAACSTALAVTLTVSLPQPTHAKHVTPPPVPSDIQVPEGNKAFLEGHAVGTQNYICLPCPNATTPAAMCPNASGFAWILFTPQATLFNDRAQQVTTHFFSPNPVEAGTVRPTWQHSRDTSTVWGGRAVASSDPDFVALDAIPWLLIPVAGTEEGPTGGDILTATTFIQRLSTSGGLAPSTGCSLSTEVGARAFVPYTAVYFFFREDDGN
jgi:Protein of unknown function (DUF3455)